MATKILALDGLNDAKLCELTAQLLETIPGVVSARIEFLSQKLTLQLDGADDAATVARVVETLERTIPGVSVSRTDVGEAFPEEAQPPEEDFAPRIAPPPPEEEPARRGFSLPIGPDSAVSLGALVVACLFFAFSFALPAGEFPAWTLTLLAALLSALFSLCMRWARKRPAYRLVTLMSIAVVAAVFVLGEARQAALGMLLYHAGALAACILCDSLDARARALIDILPESLVVLREGELSRLSPAQVAPGDCLLLRRGDTIPFDGVVKEGEAQLDTSLLTGEKEPAAARAGEAVRCGDRLLTGPLTVEVVYPQALSAARRMRDILLEAVPATPTSRMARKWTLLWSLALALAAVGVALLHYTDYGAAQWLFPALTILLLALPCGGAASADTALAAGMGRALKEGVLVRSAATLDAIARVRTVATGCTGVLTAGEYTVTGVEAAEDSSPAEVLDAAIGAELGTAHPIAAAVEDYYEATTHKKPKSGGKSPGEGIAGYGVRTMINRRVIMAGSARLMREAEVGIPPVEGEDTPRVYVAVHGEYIGSLLLDDPPRPGSEKLAGVLHRLGVERVALLTARDANAARALQEELGFDEVYAEKNLTGKEEALTFLASREEGAPVLFAGGADEIDLLGAGCSCALLGVAPTATLIAAADALIPSGEPEKIGSLVRAARGARGAVLSNLAVSFSLKLLLGVFAAFWEVPFAAAALANALLTAWCAFNAVRLFGPSRR